MKKILFLAALLCTAIAFTACKTCGEDTEAPEVSGVTLNKTTLTIAVGDGEILEYTVSPAEAEDHSVTWSSSDPTVATVNDRGMVEGVKTGTAIITVTTTDGGKTATCAVTVEAVPIASEYTTAIEAGQGIAPTSGDGTEANPYLLASAENLRWMKVQNGDGGVATIDKYYKLTTDINVTAGEWVAIKNFQGHFDGDNHKVTGKLTANADVTTSFFGFIGNTFGGSASIKNLKMEAEIFAPNAYNIGAVLGAAQNLQDGNLSFVISNCSNSGKITGNRYIGGIIGTVNLFNNSLTSLDHTLLDNCVNTGEITGKVAIVGGIVGYMYIQPKSDIESSAVKLTVKNCRNEGNISNAGEYTGGIIANASLAKGTLIIKTCANTGVIKSEETQATAEIGDNTNKYLGTKVGGSPDPRAAITIEE